MDLDELRAFLAVAEAGSFSGASKNTGIVRSTLARRIESMERRLDVSLLISTENGIELTDRGIRLSEEGPRVVAEAQAVEAAIVDQAEEWPRKIRCVISPGVHHFGTANIAARINARYPQVSWQFETHPQPLDSLSSGQADMAIQLGVAAPEGRWVSHQLMNLPMRLLASREYVEKRGMLHSLGDLEGHDLLLWQAPGLTPGTIPLLDGGEHPIRPKAASTDLMVLYEMARLGHGMTVIPVLKIPGDPWAEDHAVAVLPELVGTEISTWLIAPKALAGSQAVRLMVEESLAFSRQFGG